MTGDIIDVTDFLPQTPDLDDSLKSRRPAVRNAGHALDIIEGLFDDNDERVKEAASIRDKADGISPPLDPQKLAEEGKSHKKNFSTGFLGTVIERIIPRLVMRVKSAPHLTSSKLPTDFPQSVEKTELFRRVVTETIQGWAGWNFFLYNLADNDVKFGKAFVSYDDPDEWRPDVYRLDDCAIPNGTKQGEDPDYFAIRTGYSVKEMFEFIEDREIAEDAGWNVDNVVEAINKARPRMENEEGDTDEAALDYQDIQLELIKSESYFKDWNTIKVGILYAQEYDGKVTRYILNEDSVSSVVGDDGELFKREDEYERMGDVIQAVCYDIGNGSVYGSMGAGQKLYDLALNIEKARNQAFDQLGNRGKFFLVVQDKAALNDIETTVTDDAVYIAGAQLSNQQAALPDNSEAFLALDRYTRGLAEEKVGAFTPESMATDKSATQSRIDAIKESETTDARLDYWLTYISRVIAMMQRRLMNPDTSDPIALRAQERCLKLMDRTELAILANQMPAQTGIDWTRIKQAETVQFLMSQKGNPAWDQNFLERMIATMTIGTELTEAGLLPPNDQTEVIEATRQQQDETFTMSMQKVPVLVSPRDKHVIHMQALSGQQAPSGDRWDGQIFALLAEGNVEGAMAALEHYNSHYLIAQEQEILGEYQNVAKAFLADAQRGIQEGMQIIAESQQEEQRLIAEAQGVEQQPMTE